MKATRIFLVFLVAMAFQLSAVAALAGVTTTVTTPPTTTTSLESPPTTLMPCSDNQDCADDNDYFCDGGRACLEGLCYPTPPPCKSPCDLPPRVPAPASGSAGMTIGEGFEAIPTCFIESSFCDEKLDRCVRPQDCHHIIDFEGFFEDLPEGAVPDEVYSASGLGPIGVKGTNLTHFPEATNAAAIYDSSCPDGCTAGTDNFGTPNETFAGPGIGAGGESGEPGENADEQNNILIVTRTLTGLAENGVVTNPRVQGGNKTVTIDLDFSEVGPVSIKSFFVLDTDLDEELPQIELFGEGDVLLDAHTLSMHFGNNGATTFYLPRNRGVLRARITLFGSAAIDDVAFFLNECLPDNCCDPKDMPGYGDNPFCIEGATCCSNGKWQCNGAEGASTCEYGPGDICKFECLADEDCDNGDFCDGEETCDDGDCVDGAPPCDAFCDEGGDECYECELDADCTDGMFCTGEEWCDGGKCADNEPPCEPELCDEEDNECDECDEDSDCENDDFCDGEETCNDGTCVPDEPECSEDEFCNEDLERCDECETDEHCDDKVFCNGNETCSEGGACLPGPPPCDGDLCHEESMICDECDEDSDCPDDGIFCNGSEICIAGDCGHDEKACEDGEFCNEDQDRCDECLADEDCADDFFCNGDETCSDGACVPGSDPCSDQDPICVEDGDFCVGCMDDGDCDDGDFCNGTEVCLLDGVLAVGTADTEVGGGSCFPGRLPCRKGEICDELEDTCDDPSCMDVITFADFAQGAIVSEAYGEIGTGPIGVKGSNPEKFPEEVNAAAVFDSDCPDGCSAGLDNLGTPNETFAGPGIGEGGESGEPGENGTALGELLVVTRTLTDINPPDGLVDHPRAQGGDKTVYVDFYFDEVGPVTIKSLDFVDVDTDEAPPLVTLFNGEGGVIFMGGPDDGLGGNSVETYSPDENSGVLRMLVQLNGSAAIDNIAFAKNECRQTTTTTIVPSTTTTTTLVPLPCDSQNCTEQGTCINQPDADGGFVCECFEGWKGRLCDIVEQPCDEIPCANGKCTNVPDADSGFDCTCDEGWTGDLCDTPTGPCDGDNPCENGTCENVPDSDSGFACTCDDGWMGETCDMAVLDPCEIDPCFNGAECEAQGVEAVCVCLPDFEGEFCENELGN